jgi:hypothetical protein
MICSPRGSRQVPREAAAVFGIIGFVLFVIAAIVSWIKGDHDLALVAAGLACVALEGPFPWRPWVP